MLRTGTCVLQAGSTNLLQAGPQADLLRSGTQADLLRSGTQTELLRSRSQLLRATSLLLPARTASSQAAFAEAPPV